MTEPEYHLSNHAIVFLDVMGQRDQLRLMKKLPETPEEKKSLADVIIKTAGPLIFLRNAIKDHLNTLSEQTWVEPLAELASCNLGREIHVHFFSDTIAISTPLSEDHDHMRAVYNIHELFRLVSGVVATFNAEKIMIRGAIEIGLAINIEENEVYGPAIQAVYDMEKQSC